MTQAGGTTQCTLPEQAERQLSRFLCEIVAEEDAGVHRRANLSRKCRIHGTGARKRALGGACGLGAFWSFTGGTLAQLVFGRTSTVSVLHHGVVCFGRKKRHI